MESYKFDIVEFLDLVVFDLDLFMDLLRIGINIFFFMFKGV